MRKLPLLFALGTLSIGMITSCEEDKKSIKQVEVHFTKEGELLLYTSKTDSLISKLDIEIAETAYETQTGLMYRNSMKDQQGMLFVFNDMMPRSFYMKNTKIPLDLIFIDDKNKVVSFQENAQPLNEASLPSVVPAKYVLEVNAGLVSTWQLKVGDSMTYSK